MTMNSGMKEHLEIKAAPEGPTVPLEFIVLAKDHREQGKEDAKKA